MFTVSDVARRIKRPDEDIGRAITRVRNWTKEGLLKPIGDLNPGTGRAREYTKESLVDAFLLDTFIQCFGSSAVSVPRRLGFIRNYFLDPRQRHKLLLIGRTAGRENDFAIGSHPPSELASAIKSAGAEAYVVLDIGLLTKRLGLEEK